jgi:AraC-like DNA-binding protein
MIKRKQKISQCVKDIVFNSDIEDFQNLTVKSISKKIGVSRHHLSRKYKFETGKNPGDFLKHQKMVMSLAFLFKFPQLRVKNVAEIFGFNSYNYFISQFKLIFGKSPDRYRKFLMKFDP